MSAQRFKTGTQFCWQGQFYEVRRLLPDSDLNIVNLQTDEVQTVTFIQLFKALLEDDLRFVINGQPAKRTYQSHYIDLSDCPEHLRAIAEYRLEVIRPFLELPAHERKEAIKARVEELKAEQSGAEGTLQGAISVVSVYRWVKAYTRSGHDLRALIPAVKKRGGQEKSRLKEEVEALIQATIDDLYEVPEKITIDQIHREIAVRVEEENHHRLAEEQLELPSRATVGRRIEALDVEEKLTVKRGKRAARRALAQYGATEYPAVPMARVEIDHTQSDLIVIDEDDLLPLGRLTLTYCLETTCRYPLGFYQSFEPASYLAVMECLYHTICPKDGLRERYGLEHDWLAHGLPFTLVVDNGPEFIGRDLDDACYLLGMILERMPVSTPHFKAAVERMLGTIGTGFLHGLPGTTFSNLVQRGDYDSLKQACISQGDLDQMMHIFLIDIYAEDFHKGIQGIPARRWEETIRNGFFPRVPPSVEELRILLGRVDYRTIQPYGLEFHSLRYQSDELAPLRTRMAKRKEKQVKIKYNPSDISRLYVYDPDEERYLEVPALAQNYTKGLSLWKHQVIRNFVLNEQDQVDIVALGRAQRRIQEIVDKSLRRKKLGTRAKAARWQESGGRSESESEIVDTSAQVIAEDTPLLPASELELDLEALEAEGWSVSYDLPHPGDQKDE